MLKIGDILGDTYRIENLLNRGGFGRVWLAFDTILNRDVAIKELIEVDETRIENFVREMQIVANLGHNNIIKIHQAIPQDDNFYLVMEYCQAGSIHDELKSIGRRPYDDVMQPEKKQRLLYRNTLKSSITAKDDTLVLAIFHRQYLSRITTSCKKLLELEVSTVDRTGHP